MSELLILGGDDMPEEDRLMIKDMFDKSREIINQHYAAREDAVKEMLDNSGRRLHRFIFVSRWVPTFVKNRFASKYELGYKDLPMRKNGRRSLRVAMQLVDKKTKNVLARKTVETYLDDENIRCLTCNHKH